MEGAAEAPCTSAGYKIICEGIPSGGDLYDIPDCRAGIYRDYPKGMDILRNLLLVLRSKHSLFRQFPF